jgi:hypothetical protein
MASWERRTISEWAKAEGRQDPFIIADIESLLTSGD